MPRLHLTLLSGALLTGAAGQAQAQQVDVTGPSQQISEMSDNAEATRDPESTKKTDLLIVPIPQANPTLGTGLTLVGVLFYNPNESREPWVTGAGAMFTSNGSKALGLVHKMSLDHDRFQIVGFAGYANINIDFYGIGPNAGERDRSIEIKEKGYLGLLQGQMRLAKDFYVGARYMYLDLNSSVNRDDPLFPEAEIPTLELESKLSALGPVVSFDSRDSSFYPKHGAYLTAAWMFSSDDLGSDFSYDKFTLSANIYALLSPTTVVAGHVGLCGVSRGGPFYDLCLYGASNDLRGYETGRYRDRASWAAQVELRQRLFGKFGGALFVGAGGIAPDLGHLDEGKFLPAVGFGLRYTASKATGTNLRVDYAIGKDSNALYVSIGEAF